MPLARTIALVAVLLYLLLLAVIVTGAPARSVPAGTQTARAEDSTPFAPDGGEGGTDPPGRPGGSGPELRP